MPMTQEQVVHMPKIIAQTRVQQQHVEQTVEVPIPVSQDIVHSELMLVWKCCKNV